MARVPWGLSSRWWGGTSRGELIEIFGVPIGRARPNRRARASWIVSVAAAVLLYTGVAVLGYAPIHWTGSAAPTVQSGRPDAGATQRDLEEHVPAAMSGSDPVSPSPAQTPAAAGADAGPQVPAPQSPDPGAGAPDPVPAPSLPAVPPPAAPPPPAGPPPTAPKQATPTPAPTTLPSTTSTRRCEDDNGSHGGTGNTRDGKDGCDNGGHGDAKK